MLPLRAASVRSKDSTAVTGPETTVRAGPLMAATERLGSSSAVTSDSGRATLTIAPDGSRSKIAPRACTISSASSSEKTPAIHAAAYSPTEWPVIAAGLIPQDIHNWARA